MAVDGAVRYINPPTDAGALPTITGSPEARRALTTKVGVKVHDARALGAWGGAPTLRTNGVELVRDFTDTAAITGAVRRATGARHVFAWNHT
eukprot:gene16854-21662_t